MTCFHRPHSDEVITLIDTCIIQLNLNWINETLKNVIIRMVTQHLSTATLVEIVEKHLNAKLGYYQEKNCKKKMFTLFRGCQPLNQS